MHSITSSGESKTTKYGVVVLCRNEEESIRDCILSLINQSLKPSRIVIVNDGSFNG